MQLTECELGQIRRNLHSSLPISKNTKFIYYKLPNNMAYIYRNLVDDFGKPNRIVPLQEVYDWLNKHIKIQGGYTCDIPLLSQDELLNKLKFIKDKYWINPIICIPIRILDVYSTTSGIEIRIEEKNGGHFRERILKELYRLFDLIATTNERYFYNQIEEASQALSVSWCKDRGINPWWVHNE